MKHIDKDRMQVFIERSKGKKDRYVMPVSYTHLEANTLDATWDGTHRGQPLDPNVFVIHVVYTDQATGASGERISTVTLIR